nr:VOC family protein [Actinomyces israelii]
MKDLGAAVDDFRNRGFAVEYGRRRNPINALAYFGEGPYLELLAGTGTPKALKKLTALVGGAPLAGSQPACRLGRVRRGPVRAVPGGRRRPVPLCRPLPGRRRPGARPAPHGHRRPYAALPGLLPRRPGPSLFS